MQWAINMAVSLKYHTPDIAIQLITDGYLGGELHTSPYTRFFDVVTVVPESAYTEDGKLFPAKLKTSFYNYLAFDETIYLDVDGCCIADIRPLFNIEADFASDVQAIHTIQQGNVFNAMKWAKPTDVWQHFNLPDTARLPALNSSFMFIRKGPLCKSIFDTAHRILLENPLPADKQWHPWGRPRKTKINQPDELYINVAVAELGLIVQHMPAVHFRMVNESGETISIDNLAKNYYAIGLFGQLRDNHKSLKEHYNKHMRQCWNALVAATTGEMFNAKCEILSESKFVIQ